MTPLLKVFAPVAFVVAGILGARWLMDTAPQVDAQERAPFQPLVEARVVPPLARTIEIETQGEVLPERRIRLIAEVAARVVWVADGWRDGAFFSADVPLLRLDDTDYRLALSRAEAGVAQAKAALALAEAEAALAQRDWEELGEGDAPPLALRQPQLDRARADLAATEAVREQARRDLARCEIRAPFDCRVVSKRVDVGQFLSAGTPVAELDSTAAVEVHLPLTLAELELLGVGLGVHPSQNEVSLHGESATGRASWQGRVVGTAAALDSTSRMATVLVRVEDPYALAPGHDYPALLPGMFVRAQVTGRHFDKVWSLPRAALREGDVLLLVDDALHLHQQPVEVLQRTRDEVLIHGGLDGSVRICLTPLATVVEGMGVRLLGDEESQR